LKILALSLYGSQSASHRVWLSQLQPGLAAGGFDLQFHSLLDNPYLQRSSSGRRPSIRGLLASYGHRLQALRRADFFDLAIVYAELLPFSPAGWSASFSRFPSSMTATSPSFSNTGLAA
jgi:hypothetical protein